MRKYFFVLLSIPIFVFSFSADAKISDETWMEIYSGDSKVGHSYRGITESNGFNLLKEETVIKLVLLGTDTEINISSGYILEGHGIKSFDYDVTSDSIGLSLKGRLEGSKLTISDKKNTGVQEYTLKHEYILPSLLPSYLNHKGLKKGAEYEVYLFDPVNIYTGYDPDLLKADVKILGKEKVKTNAGVFEANKVKVDFLGSEHLFWVTDEGKSVMEKFEPSLTSVLSSRENALEKENKAFDITEKTSIASNRYIHNAREVEMMTVRIKGIENVEGLSLNDGYTQTYEKGILKITTPNPEGASGNGLRVKEKNFEQYLLATRLIQKDDPGINKQAKKIAGYENNPFLAVKLINEWTYENIEKIPTVSIPSAVDVLKTRKGDCNEHAVLFAALTRALGIPVKVILGVVYLEGRFYYHAWNEVYIGQWIPVDSTFGQFPSDATHIKLIEGDISKSPEILKVVGKMKLEVLETR